MDLCSIAGWPGSCSGEQTRQAVVTALDVMASATVAAQQLVLPAHTQDIPAQRVLSWSIVVVLCALHHAAQRPGTCVPCTERQQAMFNLQGLAPHLFNLRSQVHASAHVAMHMLCLLMCRCLQGQV